MRRVPPPKTAADGFTRALVFDSRYDTFRGVVSGTCGCSTAGSRRGTASFSMGDWRESDVKEVGVFRPKPTPTDVLVEGQVGYLVGTIRDPRDIRHRRHRDPARTSPRRSRCPGFRKVHPMVFSGVYPVNTADYEKLKHSLDKLSLNDSAFSFQAESSVALGIRFPLRVPRPAAHGSGPGAVAPGIRRGHHQHVSLRDLPYPSCAAAKWWSWTIPFTCPIPPLHRARRGADHPQPRSFASTSTLATL